MQQVMDEILWGIIEHFYLALRIFREEYQRFQKKVQEYSSENHHDEWVQIAAALTVEEWMTLISYEKFQKLAEDFFSPLLKLSNQLEMNYYTKISDHYLKKKFSELYYELFFLQNEGQHIRSHAFEHMETPNHDQIFLQTVQQIKTAFPNRLARISQLFDETQQKIENLIQQNKEARIIVRSLYLFGEELFHPIYPEGFQSLIQKIYSGDHLLELYIRAAYSFLQSGFLEEATVAYEKAIMLTQQNQATPFSSAGLYKLQELTQYCKKV